MSGWFILAGNEKLKRARVTITSSELWSVATIDLYRIPLQCVRTIGPESKVGVDIFIRLLYFCPPWLGAIVCWNAAKVYESPGPGVIIIFFNYTLIMTCLCFQDDSHTTCKRSSTSHWQSPLKKLCLKIKAIPGIHSNIHLKPRELADNNIILSTLNLYIQ